MIRLSGRDPEQIAIEYIGLRPGEKLYEELFYHDEDLAPTAHSRIRVARHRNLDGEGLRQGLELLERDVAAYNPDNLVQQMQRLIPEWERTEVGS